MVSINKMHECKGVLGPLRKRFGEDKRTSGISECGSFATLSARPLYIIKKILTCLYAGPLIYFIG